MGNMLEKLFGKCITARILEGFLKPENRNKWMGLREVSRQSNVQSGTISRSIEVLVENRLIIEEHPSMRGRIFKLNLENPYVPALIEFYSKIKKLEKS